MRISSFFVGLFMALTALAGCGGGDSPTRIVQVGTPGAGTGFEDIGALGSGSWTVNDLAAFSQASVWVGDGIADGSITLGQPTSTATFNGGIVLADAVLANDALYGRLQMNVDFAGNTISGSAGDFGKTQTGFTTQPFAPLSGTLTMPVQSISGSTLNANLGGSLSGSGGPYIVSSSLNGTYFVEQATGKGIITGNVTGTMLTGGGLVVLDPGSVFQVAQ